MSNSNYFAKFPIIEYNNINCRDLTRRVVFDKTTKNLPTFFYPYELKDGLRADTLAQAYYDDWELEWMIYLMNGIVDPYYGWYLQPKDFDSYIISKYGSVEEAQTKIKFYRLNWADFEISIQPSTYENDIPGSLKKYYSPNFGPGSKIISYIRRNADWTVNTNKVIKIILDSSKGFVEGEWVDIKEGADIVGGAEVVTVDSDVSIIVQHITGSVDTYLDAGNTVIGRSSETTGTIESHTLLSDNITDDEFEFWGPVTYWDFENEKNEANKFVRLLDARFADDVSEQYRKLLE